MAIAHSFYRAGRYADAEAELEALLAELPEHTLADDARRDLAWCRLAKGDAQDALGRFNQLAAGGRQRAPPYHPGQQLT